MTDRHETSSEVSGQFDARTGIMVADKYGRPVHRLMDPETGLVTVQDADGREILIEIPLVKGGQARSDAEIEEAGACWICVCALIAIIAIYGGAAFFILKAIGVLP